MAGKFEIRSLSLSLSLDAIKVFTADDTELFENLTFLFQDIKKPPEHPVYGKKVNNEKISSLSRAASIPHIRLTDGHSEIFIPTKTMVDTILGIHFFLRHGVSIGT